MFKMQIQFNSRIEKIVRENAFDEKKRDSG